MFSLLKKTFTNGSTKATNKAFSKKRGLRMEPLEDRQMLSVTPYDFATSPLGNLFQDATDRYDGLTFDPGDYANHWVMNDLTDNVGDILNALTYSKLSTGNDIVFIIDTYNDADTVTVNNAIAIDHFETNNGITFVWVGRDDLTFAGGTIGSRIFDIAENDGAIGIVGINITGGNATSGSVRGAFGGGVYSKDNANLFIAYSTISGNTADHGGGIFSEDSNLVLFEVTVDDNHAVNGFGGGVFSRSSYIDQEDELNYSQAAFDAFDHGSLTITGGEVTNNTSNATSTTSINPGLTVGYGGGIFASRQEISIYGTLISDNETDGNGGGLYINNTGQDHIKGTFTDDLFDVTIENVTVTGNTGDAGGGLHFKGTMDVIDSLFEGNTAVNGGAIFGYNNSGSGGVGTAAFDRVEIRGNDADYGGGVYISGFTPGHTSAIFSNSLIVENEATENGGGFYNLGDLVLNNVTVAGNEGGGLYTTGASAALTVNNSIISENYTAAGVNDDLVVASGAFASNYSIYGSGVNAALFASNGLDYTVWSDTFGGPFSYDDYVDYLNNNPLVNNIFNYDNGAGELFKMDPIDVFGDVFYQDTVEVTISGLGTFNANYYTVDDAYPIVVYQGAYVWELTIGSTSYYFMAEDAADGTSFLTSDAFPGTLGDLVAVGEWKNEKVGETLVIHDYSPSATSWAIDTGDDGLAVGDYAFNGVDRIVSRVDRGAYEASVAATFEIDAPEVLWPGIATAIDVTVTNTGDYNISGSWEFTLVGKNQAGTVVFTQVVTALDPLAVGDDDTYTVNVNIPLAALGGEADKVTFTVELVLAGNTEAVTKQTADVFVGPVFTGLTAPVEDPADADNYACFVTFSEDVTYTSSLDSIQLWVNAGAAGWSQVSFVEDTDFTITQVSGNEYKISWAKSVTRAIDYASAEINLVVYGDAFEDADGYVVKGTVTGTSIEGAANPPKDGVYRISTAWIPTLGNAKWNTISANATANYTLDDIAVITAAGGNVSHTFTPGLKVGDTPVAGIDYIDDVTVPNDGIMDDSGWWIEITDKDGNVLATGAGSVVATPTGTVTISSDGQSFTYEWGGTKFAMNEKIYYRYMAQDEGNEIVHWNDANTDGIMQLTEIDIANVVITVGYDFSGSLLVTTLVDEFDGHFADITAGTGLSLREALDYAKYINNPSIQFAPGLLNGASYMVLGELFVDFDVIILGSGQYLVGDGFSRIMNVNGGASTIDVKISDMTFKDGYADFGAGLRVNNADVYLQDVNFIRNVASQRGGAIYFNGSAALKGDLTVIGGDINYNSADQGGGIYSYSDNTTIDGTKFTGNHASFAGALYQYGAVMNVTNADFMHNSSTNNAGAFAQNSAASQETNFDHCTFVGNTALGSGGALSLSGGETSITDTEFEYNSAYVGGAILQSSSSASTLDNVIFDSNTAQNMTFTANKVQTYGGAMALIDDASTLVENTSFYKNRATGVDAGRGGAFYQANNAVSEFANVTFDGNTTQGRGGAVAIVGGDTNIDDATFNRNTAYNGGAIYLSGADQVLTNLTLTNNRATNDGGAIHHYGGSMELSNSTLKTNVAEGTTGGGGGLWIGSAIHESSLIGPKVAFENNDATNGRGGGIFVSSYVQDFAVTLAIDTVFAGNTASQGPTLVRPSDSGYSAFINNKKLKIVDDLLADVGNYGNTDCSEDYWDYWVSIH